MGDLKLLYEGKVREVYDNGDSLIMVATDRISVYDIILKNKITDKGAFLPTGDHTPNRGASNFTVR